MLLNKAVEFVVLLMLWLYEVVVVDEVQGLFVVLDDDEVQVEL